MQIRGLKNTFIWSYKKTYQQIIKDTVIVTLILLVNNLSQNYF